MRNFRDYATITAGYWVFTLTDGALRMLVLFHLHRIGYSPLEVVSLFLFYEFFGVVTNFVGGSLGARFGLDKTLFAGLGLQVFSCSLLAVMAGNLSVPAVMVAQAISGIAKDLTKMSSKSYIKLVVPESDGSALMKWVAILTGSKNALKGMGFFLGGVLLETVGFRAANTGMAVALFLALAASFALLPRAAGQSKVALGQMIPQDPRVRWLAAARLFLFASRDVWFVFALPIFLSVNLGYSFAQSGGFLATWIIGYGFVQALAPAYVGAPEARRVTIWTALLVVPLVGIATLLHYGFDERITLIVGLAVFAILFATNSAMHSYLIIRYAQSETVSLSVGFYYMANAAGRLAGTILSGAVFQWSGMGSQGLFACLVVAIAFVIVSTLLCVPLRAAETSRAGHD